MGVVGFFLVQVTLRANVVRAAPGNAFVAAKHDGGDAGVGHAGDVCLGSAQMDFIPARDRLDGDVRITGQERFPGDTSAACDDPIVAACSELLVTYVANGSSDRLCRC